MPNSADLSTPNGLPAKRCQHGAKGLQLAHNSKGVYIRVRKTTATQQTRLRLE